MDDESTARAIEVALLLHRVYSTATRRLDSALRPMDFGSRHLAVMFLIRDGVETQRDLVARLGADKTGMVRTVDDLERLGYVSRTPSTRDRRVTILELTEQGRQAITEAQTHTRAVAGELFQAVGAGELGTLHSMLTRMLASDEIRP